MEFIKLYPDQDPKNLYLYEIIGSYFTDVIFNHIYLNTKIKLGKSDSFLDEYSKRLQLYMMGIKNDKKCYNSVFQGLHKYYDIVLSRNTTEQSFMDIMINTFVPSDFIEEMSNSYRIELISNVICELVANLISYASSPKLISLIISNHVEQAKVTIKTLQDYSIHVLINKKVSILNKIMKETGQVQDERSPPIEVIDNMKTIIKNLVEEKNDLIEDLKDKEEQIERLLENEKKLKKLILLLNIQTNIYKKHSKVNSMQNEFVEEVIQKTEGEDIFNNVKNIEPISKQNYPDDNMFTPRNKMESYDYQDKKDSYDEDRDKDYKEEDYKEEDYKEEDKDYKEDEDKDEDKAEKEDEEENIVAVNNLQVTTVPRLTNRHSYSDTDSDIPDSDDS